MARIASPFSAYLKEKAKSAKEFLGSKGYEISHSHTLELVSKLSGFHDWNTASKAEPTHHSAIETYPTPREIQERYPFPILPDAELMIEPGNLWKTAEIVMGQDKDRFLRGMRRLLRHLDVDVDDYPESQFTQTAVAAFLLMRIRELYALDGAVKDYSPVYGMVSMAYFNTINPDQVHVNLFVRPKGMDRKTVSISG